LASISVAGKTCSTEKSLFSTLKNRKGSQTVKDPTRQSQRVLPYGQGKFGLWSFLGFLINPKTQFFSKKFSSPGSNSSSNRRRRHKKVGHVRERRSPGRCFGAKPVTSHKISAYI